MEVQAEVAHAKKDRRAGLIATIVIHAVIIALLIWSVLPKSDPPIEELGGAGLEIGLGGIEGEGAEGAPGGGEPQPSENTEQSAVEDNSTDENIISNDAEDDTKVVPPSKTTKTKKKNTTTPVKDNKKQQNSNPINSNLKNLNDILGSGGGDEGGGGNGTQGNGPGAGGKGTGLGSKGNGNDASNGRGKAKPTRILTVYSKENHNCKGSSIQVVRIQINKNGKIIKVEGNGPGTVNSDPCFKERAEKYVLNNYVYDSCTDCDAIRKDEAKITLDATDQ